MKKILTWIYIKPILFWSFLYYYSISILKISFLYYFLLLFLYLLLKFILKKYYTAKSYREFGSEATQWALQQPQAKTSEDVYWFAKSIRENGIEATKLAIKRDQAKPNYQQTRHVEEFYKIAKVIFCLEEKEKKLKQLEEVIKDKLKENKNINNF